MTYDLTGEVRTFIDVKGNPITQKVYDTDTPGDLAVNFGFPSQHIRFKPNTPYNILVDIDGTINPFRMPNEEYVFNGEVRHFHYEDIFEAGYFMTLPPKTNVIEAVRALKYSGLEVFSLSAVEPRSVTAYVDKNRWLDVYVPEVDDKHRIFVPCGTKKVDFLNLENTVLNFMLDDYTRNLQEFTSVSDKNVGIKILNGINDTHKSWQGYRVDGSLNSIDLSKSIVDIFLKEMGQRGCQHL